MPPFNSIVVYGLDISDRKDAEKDLKKSELRYSSLFNKMNEGYCLNEIILDNHGRPVDYRFLDINPAFEEITGLKRKDIVGRTIKELIPGTRMDWIKDYGHVALSGKPIRVERFDEENNKWYEIFAYKPAEMQFAILYLDITDLKRADEEKSNFISIMSHELRNPLTPILAGAQFLRESLRNGQLNIEVLQNHSFAIERQAQNMAKLLDDLLDISRANLKKISIEKKLIDVAAAMHEAAEATHSLLKEKKQSIIVYLPALFFICRCRPGSP
jgi:PAS domain S-box-containing protein